ncbi:putative F-box/LRR-repeat protein 23 [Tanacetum coccineum]
MTRSTSKSKKQRDWLDLPSDVMVNILSRIVVVEILWNVQMVCTKWHEICKDPYMWRSRKQLVKCVDGCGIDGQGNWLYHIVQCCDVELLEYVVDRSSQLRRLTIALSYDAISDEGFTKALKKLPLLEEITVYNTIFSHTNIEALGSYCLLLKTLKLHGTFITRGDELPEVIVQNLPQLRHLELIWLDLSDSGLRAILDGCRHLQLLDLRMCEPIKLKGELRKRCLEQIKCVKLPTDPIKYNPYSDRDDYVDLISWYRNFGWEYEDDGTEDHVTLKSD